MDALFGLAGVVLGFALGFAAQWWRERREARSAAALVLGELASNATTLKQIKAGRDLDTLQPLSRDVWDRHGLLLLRILRGEPLTKVYVAYHALDTFEYAARWLQHTHDEVQAVLDEERRKDEPELTSSQAIWLKGKADQAVTVREQRDALAATVPNDVGKLEEAIAALARYRPFED